MTGTRAVLFDSGDTLIYAKGGEWLPGELFRQMVREMNLALDWRRLPSAHQAAFRVLERDDQRCLSEDEEVARFKRYFEVLLSGMGAVTSDTALARDIARATVERLPVACFQDTVPTLERLSARGLQLGIISNGWPSLKRRYRELGLCQYFDVFVVSAHLGARKPDPLIFEHAAARLGIPPREALFVDDAAVNVAAACATGFRGVLLARSGPPDALSTPWVSGLQQIERLL